MKNSIYAYIFTSRFRQVSERKRNIIVCVAAVLVGFMISLSNTVFINSSKNNIEEIESVYGKFDVVIALNNIDKMDVLEDVLKDDLYVIVQHDSGFQNDYNLIVINSISDYLRYNDKTTKTGNAIISATLAKDFGVHENEEISVGEKVYNIALVSDDINRIIDNEKESFLIENKKTEWKNPIYLLYLDHSTENINAIQKEICEVLNTEDYVMSSNYNTYKSMLEDMESLRSALVFFVMIMIVLAGFMILYSYNNVFTERMRYWNILRCLGLSKKKMLMLVAAELTIYVGIGALCGIILGTASSLLVCKISDIKMFIFFPDIWTYTETILVCLINILLIMFMLERKIKDVAIIDIKNSTKTAVITKPNKVFGFVSKAIVLLTILLRVAVAIRGGSLFLGVFLLVMSIGTIFVLIYSFCSLHKQLTKTGNSMLYLCGTNMKSHYMLTKGISIALTITFVIFFLLNSMLQAYQKTAISAVNRQLKYDLMAYKEGIASEEDLNYMSEYKYSTIYEDIGKINFSANIYLCGLMESDIYKIYSKDIFEQKKWNGKFQNNEAVISQYVANIYNISLGDTISILYDSKEYKLKICNIIDTNDFGSQVIYFDIKKCKLAEHFYSDKTYYYFNGDVDETNRLKNYFEDIKEFTVMDITNVKKQWMESTSAALKPMRIFAGLICIVLLFIALCMLFSANKEKQYDYSLMVLMGYQQKKIYRVVFLEIMSVIAVSILIAYGFSVLCNSSILYIIGLISNYELLLVNTWKENLLLVFIAILGTGLIAWIFAKRLMKKDIYNIIIKGVERC